MSNGYTINDGDIELGLPENDLASIMSDVLKYQDLLLPFIRVVNNTIVFRAQDLKLLDPTIFFLREIPSFSMNKTDIISILVLGLISLLIGLYLSIGHGGLIVVFVCLISCIVSLLALAVSYFYNRFRFHERHRRALYLKAQLLSFFYMTVLQEQTTVSERSERTTLRLRREAGQMKDVCRFLYDLSDSNTKSKVGECFPDGELIKPLSNKFS